jgi:hypothetical protein
VSRFIGHFTTRLGTTSNYSATANLHTLQITAEHIKPSTTCGVFTSRSLATASNSEDPSASALEPLVSGEYPANELSTQICPSAEPHRKHSSSAVEYVFVAAGTCLPSRYQATRVPSRDHLTTTVLHAVIFLNILIFLDVEIVIRTISDKNKKRQVSGMLISLLSSEMRNYSTLTAGAECTSRTQFSKSPAVFC